MWLIIGYGNPLRGDDAAGPALATQLRDQLAADRARILVVHQLTPELVLELVKPEIAGVLFLDAKRLQGNDLKLVPLTAELDPNASCGHQVSPQLLLGCAEHLYSCQRPGWLLTLRGVDFAFGEELSATATASLAKAVERCNSFLACPEAS